MLRKFLVVGAVLATTRIASAVTIVDPDFVDTTVASNVGAPTAMAWAPDGSPRLFVTSKGGEVLIIENGVKLSMPFAQVSPIHTSSECGLLGLAFDPDFIDNQYVYFFVTVSDSEQQIVRYTAHANVGTDKQVLVAGLPTLGKNHNGGGLAFGPDGKLYFSIGDNGARLGVGTDLTLMNAKVGRVNRDGSVPSDNPFFDGDGPHNDYIWASGFRNPFTMTFQPATSRMWLNVVGTNWEQIFMPSAGDNGGWNSYESNQPAGYLPPVISYATDAVESHTIPASGTVRLAGVTTVYTADLHRFRPGARITVADVTDSSFDGTFAVSEVLSPTQFSYAQAGPDAISGSGSASSMNLGGCVTGGTFWDSSAVPPAYRGNFFFGDYNSGRIVRASLDSDSHVVSVDEWASGADSIVDTSIGFDGDLYFASTSGDVHRISYNAAVQGLVVSQRNIRLVEGGKAAFDVRLALATAGPRTVTLAATGDADVVISEGVALTFTADNWSLPQRVVLSAAADVDSLDDTARVRVASSRLAPEDIVVRVTEAEVSSFVVSPTNVELNEGETVQILVALSDPPPSTLTVAVSSSGDSDVQVASGSQLSFTSDDWATPQAVTISAVADDDNADDSAILRISGRGRTSRQLAVRVIDANDSSPGGAGSPGMSGGGRGEPEPSAGGQRGSEGGQPMGEGGQLMGEGGQLMGEGGQLMGEGGQLMGEGGQPMGEGGQANEPPSGGVHGDEGCTCGVAGASADSYGLMWLALGLCVSLRRRRGRALSAA